MYYWTSLALLFHLELVFSLELIFLGHFSLSPKLSDVLSAFLLRTITDKEILSYVTLSAYLSFVLIFLVAELVDLNSLVGIDHFMCAAPGCGSSVDVLWRYRNCDDAVISPLLCPRTAINLREAHRKRYSQKYNPKEQLRYAFKDVFSEAVLILECANIFGLHPDIWVQRSGNKVSSYSFSCYCTHHDAVASVFANLLC